MSDLQGIEVERSHARSIGVRRLRLSIGDAWIECTHGTGAAHGAALGLVYGVTHPVVQACIRMRRERCAVVAYLLVPDAQQGRGIGSSLLARAIAELPVPMYACLTPDEEHLMPALRRFYAGHGFVACEPDPWMRRLNT